MTEITRRSLIKTTAAAAAASAFHSPVASGAQRDKRPKLGFIGCGGRAQSLVKPFLADAEIVWACDTDRQRAESFAKKFNASKSTNDLRQILDDPKVDAVVVATPDHWHAPAAIMACEAGKHVYVEKPCSHNLREGRLLLDAARRNNVVVQHGTQFRSSQYIADAIKIIEEGTIGDVLVCKAWNVQRRRNIGHANPTDPPASLDYDTWVGPAEWVPFQKNRFHYDWHWWHNFGTGDIGNDGVHDMDIARWGLGVTGLPSLATAIGGKYYFDDDQQFPDTATCAFEWPGDGSVGQRRQLIFEMRIWSRSYPHNCDSGIEWYGTKGMLFVSKRGKLQMWDESNKSVSAPKPSKPAVVPRSHQANFLECIRTGARPTADIEIGHDSASLCHLANIAIRREQTLHIDPKSEFVTNDEASNAMLTRSYREEGHWSVPKGV